MVICSVHFRFTNMNWTDNGYGTIGGIELAAILLTCVSLIIGVLAICTKQNGLLMIFIIFIGLSSLFTIAIVIFAFIGTQYRQFDDYLGCNGDYKGLLSIWNAVDNYMYSVDSLLCSESCPCYLGERSTLHYSTNSSTAPYYNMWEISQNPGDASRFQDCPKKVQGLAKAEYYSTNAYFNHTFKPDKFNSYFAKVEKYFKCTGFCGTTYFNGKTGTNQKIVKYLFSDISEESIPEHFGCIDIIVGWLRQTLNAFAALGCILFVIEIILLIVAILLLVGTSRPEPDEEDEKNVSVQEEQNKPQQDELQEYKPKKVQPEQVQPQSPQRDEEQPEERNDEDGGVPQLNSSFKPPQEQLEENELNFNPSTIKN